MLDGAVTSLVEQCTLAGVADLAWLEGVADPANMRSLAGDFKEVCMSPCPFAL